MPTKLETYIQNLRNDRIKNLKLPSIGPKAYKPTKNSPKQQQPPSPTKQNQPNPSYSKPKPINNQSIITLNPKTLKTQQSPLTYNNLSKLQQNIMMQIKNIDVCLESQRNQRKQTQKQKTSLFGGCIFLSEVNQLLVDRFHQCLQIQSDASYSVTDGFEVSRYVTQVNGEVGLIEGKIVNNVPSMSNKLLAKSINAIQSYDEQMNLEYVKNYGKEWSLHKPNNNNLSPNQQHELEKQLLSRNYSVKQSNYSFVQQNESKLSLFPLALQKNNTNESRSTQLFQSKLTFLTGNSKITLGNAGKDAGDVSLRLGVKNQKERKRLLVFKTEPQQVIEESRAIKLTRRDVKLVLQKSKNIVSVWMPPASYPQFFGVFSYKLIKSLHPLNPHPSQSPSYKCKLTKYFFNKFGLNKKIFDSIIDYLVFHQNLTIESLEITIDKVVFNRVFAKMGWVLKSWESVTKVKASYFRQVKED